MTGMDTPGPVVFFGTPQFAVPSLEALADSGFRPALVVSQPSRPVGRGRRIQVPPVVERAQELGLHTEQVEKVRSTAFLDRLEALSPWIGVVVAFGQIFPKRLLEIPTAGCLNVHASLLPRYRGAAPIQAAIQAGDSVTGVTTQQMASKLDSGPIFLERQVSIGATETAPELAIRLAEAGAELLLETLEAIASRTIEAHPQDESDASWAPRLEKEDSEVDWSLSAGSLYNKFRALQPWPGLRARFDDEDIKLLDCRPATKEEGDGTGMTQDLRPGTISSVSPCLEVVCGDGEVLILERVQRPSRRPLTGVEFANGERLSVGDRFGGP